MHDRICLVTGATSGIGKVTALELAQRGATVILHGRDASRSAAVQAEIKAKSGNPHVEVALADFRSLDSVRQLAQTVLSSYTRLDVLVNNAGLFINSFQRTADGYEETFAVNHLAPFLLTNLLLDRMKASAHARIINVTSAAHQGAKMRFDALNLEQGYNGWRAYSESKLANILFTYELASRLQGSNLTANCLHPGFVASNFGRDRNGIIGTLLGFSQIFALTPEQGAETQVYLASAPEVAGVSGKYFDKNVAVASSPASYDKASQQTLWQRSEQLVQHRASSVP